MVPSYSMESGRRVHSHYFISTHSPWIVTTVCTFTLFDQAHRESIPYRDGTTRYIHGIISHNYYQLRHQLLNETYTGNLSLCLTTHTLWLTHTHTGLHAVGFCTAYTESSTDPYSVHCIPPVFACSRTFVRALGLSIVTPTLSLDWICPFVGASWGQRSPRWSRGCRKFCWAKHFSTWPPESVEVGLSMDVDAILATSTAQHKSTEVNKEVELQFDLRNLLATDLNFLDTETLRYICWHMNQNCKFLHVCIKRWFGLDFFNRRTKDEYLKEIMRDNTQLLINKVWEVWITRVQKKLRESSSGLPFFLTHAATHWEVRWLRICKG